MDMELMAVAAPVAAALIARIPSSQPNGGISDDEVKSAFMQAIEAVAQARLDSLEGRWVLPEFRNP